MKCLYSLIALLVITTGLWGQPARAQSDGAAPRFAIVDVRVFDGRTMHENWTVVVANHHIQAAGEDVTVPEGYKRIDGTGKTLLPGLIDAHVHVFGNALKQALNFGVTTVFDMFTSPALLEPAEKRLETLAPQERADMLSAGILATAPGGHGTEYGMDIPTLTGPDEAEAWVEARIAEGSDYIKIVYNEEEGRFPSISEATLKALIDAAHAHGKMAVVHVMNLESARTAIQAGADGLVHVFGDEKADEAFIELIKQSGAFVIPTLSVWQSVAGISGAKRLLSDESLAPYITPSIKQQLHSSFGGERDKSLIRTAKTNVRLLNEAGVPILAGTDAPNPGTAHGISLHHELVLLTESGLSNTEALAAATSVPARIFGLEKRGRIAEGMIADLLLVKGNPAEEITATTNIVRVWKDGYPVDRTSASERKAKLEAQVPEAPEDTVIGRFDEAGKVGHRRVRTDYGFGWVVTTDAMRGGESTATMKRVTPGADGSAGALAVSGEIRKGFMWPWAGVMFFPADKPMQPVDFSGKSKLVFYARGDGGSYRLMLFSGASGPGRPSVVRFETTKDWQKHVVPLSEFKTVHLATLRAIGFVAGPAPGQFHFTIDEVSVR